MRRSLGQISDSKMQSAYADIFIDLLPVKTDSSTGEDHFGSLSGVKGKRWGKNDKGVESFLPPHQERCKEHLPQTKLPAPFAF
ncbi:hypothetical protein [Leptospira stimsonii]|uniref:hypothetical protein n=1 Tax=Leptospira stimsonii TaxID=2202203 RepID=UPI0019D64908|nr:hypothetical protein [Leptospira stimsonii]